MDPYERAYERPNSRRPFKKYSALFLLVLLGCCILFFSIVLIGCAFVVNYSDDFEIDGTNAGIEEVVQSGFNYAQYWAGIPFLVTGILIICSGVFQLNRDLTIATVVFCIISFGLMLFVISLDGPNWMAWNSQQRLKSYWDDVSGVDCQEGTGASVNFCVCQETTTSTAVRTFSYACSAISQLSALYGAIVGSAIIVALCCIIAILVITKSLSWKYRYRYPFGFFRNRYAEPSFEPEPIAIPMKRRRRYSTSFIELAPRPYEDYVPAPLPYDRQDYVPAALPFHNRGYIEGPPPFTRGYSLKPKHYHKHHYY